MCTLPPKTIHTVCRSAEHSAEPRCSLVVVVVLGCRPLLVAGARSLHDEMPCLVHTEQTRDRCLNQAYVGKVPHATEPAQVDAKP